MDRTTASRPALREARLVKILEPFPGSGGHAPHPLYLAEVEGGGAKRTVVLKLMERRSVVSEAAALIVANALGLPTLEGFLVVDVERFGESFEEQLPTSPLQFATTRERLTSLYDKGIGWEDEFWNAALETRWFRTLFVFDVLVGNYDRVCRNIQFRGEPSDDALVVCDHDRMFLSQRWNPLALSEARERPGPSNLARFAGAISDEGKARMRSLAESWSQRLISAGVPDFSPLAARGLTSSLERKHIRRFIEYRAAHLPDLVAEVLERR